jgi:DNA polymerase-3 subunit delta'
MLAESFAHAYIRKSNGIEVPSSSRTDYEIHRLSAPTEVHSGVSKTKDIPLDHVREVLRVSSLRASGAGRRVVLIDDAHRLRVGAQNALLKSLEESYPGLLFILVTSHPEALLETVRSRVFPVRFSLVVKKDFPDEITQEEYILCGGRPGIFVRMRKENEFRHDQEELLEQWRNFCACPLWEKFQFAQRFAKQGDHLKYRLRAWLRFSHTQAFQEQAPSLKDLQICEALGKSISRIERTNTNVRLALEQLALEIDRIIAGSSTEREKIGKIGGRT